MARFFVDDIRDHSVYFLTDARHMAQILRLKKGDTVTALDGRGRQAEAEICSVDKDEVVARIDAWDQSPAEPKLRAVVYQGICRPERFETAVQKCTELGAHAIVPLLLARSQTKPRDMDKRLERLNRIVREAAKQSGRAAIPEVRPSAGMEQIAANKHDLLLCPYEFARAFGIRRVVQAHADARSIGIVVGPEGGLTEEEVARLKAMGGHIVTLGPRMLRTETAAPAVLAVAMALLGEWDGEAD